jgi:mRNA interferase MazF
MMASMNRGEVRLVNLYPVKGSEPGKKRPCVIVQTNVLNEVPHPTTIVFPLSASPRNENPMNLKIVRRDNLEHDSYVLLDQIRTVDNSRFVGDVLTTLTSQELFVMLTRFWKLVS